MQVNLIRRSGRWRLDFCSTAGSSPSAIDLRAWRFPNQPFAVSGLARVRNWSLFNGRCRVFGRCARMVEDHDEMWHLQSLFSCSPRRKKYKEKCSLLLLRGFVLFLIDFDDELSEFNQILRIEMNFNLFQNINWYLKYFEKNQYLVTICNYFLYIFV